MKGIQKRISKVRREISVLANDKVRQIQERRKLGVPLVCIAGYYNAGKTTLFNLLTGESKLVGDRPFKTLSSKYARLQLNHNETPIFIDTIGFVVGLDPALIKSFQLNLMDMNEADLLLFMVGVDDQPDYLFHKLKFGLHLLKELGVESQRILVVLNKVDIFDGGSPEAVLSKLRPLLDQYDWTSISAKKRDGVDKLLDKILTKIKDLPPKKELVPANSSLNTKVATQLARSAASDQDSVSDRLTYAADQAASKSASDTSDSEDTNDEEEGEFDQPPLQ